MKALSDMKMNLVVELLGGDMIGEENLLKLAL